MEHEQWRADPDMSGRTITSQQASVAHVQRELGILLDASRLRHFEDKLHEECQWPHLRRMREIRNSGTCHRWLWHINPLEGSIMAEDDYVKAVQRRMCARVIEHE
eukprot:10973482-Karenia_brevis.AAC.1